MSEPDCGCRVNVIVSAPGAKGYTVGVNDTTFHFCPLHAAAPDLLAALEESLNAGIELTAAICDLGMSHVTVGPSLPRFAKALSQAYSAIKISGHKAKLPA